MNKAIEEKAIIYLKTFIEDSKVISQYISENDKEPCWDGHLYLYSDGIQDKNHLQGRVPVQIKGTEVNRFNINNFKFKVNKNDLRAYLYEPTLYIVVQIKKDSKERKMFYIELLPEIVKNILNDMAEHNSKKIPLKPLTENLSEFEKQLWAFMWNSKRMISFAGKNHLNINDITNKNIRTLSFVKPYGMVNLHDILKYISSHETYIYGKPKDFDIDIPVMNVPVRMTFTKDMDKIVKVKDTVFYENCKSEIKNGIERILNVLIGILISPIVKISAIIKSP